MPGRRAGGQRERGSVTAEIAVALPALMLVVDAALWGVSAASAQVACFDAARAGARAASRGEPMAAVRAMIRHAAPPTSYITVRRDRDLSRVEVTAEVRA